ncbi:hypothetical protein CORC01_00328 [Colletotrichum orchidophilum]|uniref:Uncharacterized protein n=1 Tax=Colletotrichum orchidophilum TaxID=1209926 RepID=A0A1G4BT31_9PEZI|nr:uncharacterized protein CORC01_00328 [Colletotrichum orchidophilum]OHF04476.1 hypothetical protein CORC01_00328 [Colletotrichum orchidophilum]
MSSIVAEQGSAKTSASGGQLSLEKKVAEGASNRLRDFEEDIGLEFASSDRTGGHERQEKRVQRASDVVAMVDRLYPGAIRAAGDEAQPNNGQTKDLRGAGAQFSE